MQLIRLWFQRIPQSPFRYYGVRGLVIALCIIADGLIGLFSLGLWWPNLWVQLFSWEMQWAKKHKL